MANGPRVDPNDDFNRETRERAQRATAARRKAAEEAAKTNRANLGNQQNAKAQTRFQRLKQGAREGLRRFGRAVFGGGGGPEGVGTTREEALRRFEKSQGKLAKAGRVAKFGATRAPAVGLGVELATTPTDELPARLSRLNPVTAIPTAVQDFAIRRARGEETGPALSGAFRGAVAPIEPFGIVDQPEDDPFRGREQSLFERGVAAAGLGPDQEMLDTLAAEDVAATAAQGTGAGLPTEQQRLTLRDAGVDLEPGRGVTLGGAPAAQFETDPVTGEQSRLFTDADARAAAAGIDPASRRGTASLEENIAVAQRLSDRGARDRAQGLRAAAAEQGDQRSLDERILERLAGQARGGGLASAFGALSAGGNILRRQAAERARGAAAEQAVQESNLRLRNKLTEIGAQSQVDQQANLSKDAVSLAESFNTALGQGEQQAGNVASAIMQTAGQNPNSAAGAAAAQIVGDSIRNNTEEGRIGAFFNWWDALWRGERGPIDAIQAGTQGGFNNDAFNNAMNEAHIRQDGMIMVPAPAGTGEFQEVTNIDNLPPYARDYMIQNGLRRQGERQPITRGAPQAGPTQPALRRTF